MNYISILRKGEVSGELKNAKYILLTETSKILKMANELAEDHQVPLATNMYILTNRLWYDLNKGFGAEDFPMTFDVLAKSQIVLSNILSAKVADNFERVKHDFEEEKIGREELVGNIIALREAAKKPEEITSDHIDEITGFISEQEINIYKLEKEKLSSRVMTQDQQIEGFKRMLQNSVDEMQKGKYRERALEKEIQEREKWQCEKYSQQKQRADNKIRTKMQMKRVITIIIIVMGYGILIWHSMELAEKWQKLITACVGGIPILWSVIGGVLWEKKLDVFALIKRIDSVTEQKLRQQIYEEYGVDFSFIQSDDKQMLECKGAMADE